MAATSRFAIATHLCTSLALEAEKGHGSATSEYLASSVNTHPVVIRRLLGQLAKAELVSTCPGKHGGFGLARPAKNISLWDIYQAIGAEPIFAPNPHAVNPNCPVSRHMKQALDPVMLGAEDALKKELSRRKLSTLASELKDLAA